VLTLVSSDARLSTATPLLALLFVESAVDRVKNGQGFDALPQAIPEVFRDYVRRLNPKTGPTDQLVDDDMLEAAACAVATVCLGSNRVPTDFAWRDAAAHVAQRMPAVAADRVLQRLAQNGVLDHMFA
jgi:hypothetical protein